MTAFGMTCTCGHEMTVEAPDRGQAVALLQGGMTQDALDAHWESNHSADSQKPTLEQVRGMIGQLVAAK